MFDPINPKQSFPDLERGMLKYWQEEDIFKRSLRSLLALDTQEARDKETTDGFSFYDGPPFATGLPHYGHILAGTIKDVIPRYQTMQGKHVQRRFGWDCHGLPVEYEVEKEFGLDRDKIKAMGVKAFNDLCRSVVLRYTKEWRETVERVGRWVDMDWDYRTMDPDYMESIWWAFKQLFDKGLIYEGHKPMHICPRCVTPLSNFEVTQEYKDITDQSAVVTFELVDEPGTFVLAWTTTPWTLPGNLFLAVHPDISYVKVSHEGNTYIIAEGLLETPAGFKGKEYAVTGPAFKGSKLLKKKYKPLFPYFVDRYPNAFYIVSGDFVTTDDGTGIVHIAPGFGEDDFAVGKREEVALLQHVTMEGRFIKEVTDFAGQEVKPKDDPTKTDQKVIQYLKSKNTLFAQISYPHPYPHCWRCDTPLLNYATSSWFVAVEKIKDAMLKANGKTAWVPAHIRDGRFGKWLENSRDWAISRSRYWGTPLPLWRNDETGEIVALGSRDELIAKDPNRFMKLTILRHGESEHNLPPVHYQSSVPGSNLTEKGKNQSKRSALLLKDKSVQFLYSSPFSCTQQTAEFIRAQAKVDIVTDDRIREVNFGEYDGKSVDFNDLSFVKERRAHKLEKNAIENIYHLPGMETWEELEERVHSFLKDIIEKHQGHHVVVVTHAEIITVIKHFFTREDPRKLTGQPLTSYATPEAFYWDYSMNAPLDLHKETVDGINWTITSPEEAVHLTVVRHGESDWNAEKRICGKADRPLTEQGETQAKAFAANVKKGDYDVLLCSNLERAKKTASYISESLSLEALVEDIFTEQDFGSYEGKTLEEIKAIDEGFAASFKDNLVDMPQGESADGLRNRAREAIRMLRERYKGKRVMVVAHGRFISAMKQVEKGAHGHVLYPNCHAETFVLAPKYRRIPDVLDCWFESGSMPYAQSHYPFEAHYVSKDGAVLPPGFPADFIAEGIDQTRGWFYTLTVLSAALFDKPAFEHCVVNGTVLAEDGKKMSKRLKNYPEPLTVVEKHGADAVRFALMQSPAVRGEDLRFSERLVEETLRNVLLPFWNTYSFFVTYANAANWEPQATRRVSNHPLDQWILSEMQDLVNRMTKQLDAYDLSATCTAFVDIIDNLTNWYVRLSRRRFAGKGGMLDDTIPETSDRNEDQQAALATLYDVLLTLSQLLAPFCPFMTDAMYLNLTGEPHGSVHLTRWPKSRELSAEEQALVRRTRLMRLIVSLGLGIRSDVKIKVRQPLAKAVIAMPPDVLAIEALSQADLQLLRDELNVKSLEFVTDPGSLAIEIAQVDARKAGPRLGKNVQTVIQAGKKGEFTKNPDGSLTIAGETLAPDEVTIMYRSTEGDNNTAGDRGVVIRLDTTVTDELKREGDVRDLIRGVQRLRKEQGLEMLDTIQLAIENADDLLEHHGSLIERETNATLGDTKGANHTIELDGRNVTIRFVKR